MLPKLLKYDLKSLFKYLWIAMVASLGLSVMCGYCIALTANPRVDKIVQVAAAMLIMFTAMGAMAAPVVGEVLVFVRYYKNFFTDEGYLTFTLPAKRSTLLNSKLISAVMVNTATSSVVMLNIFIVAFTAVGGKVAITWIRDMLRACWFVIGESKAFLLTAVLAVVAMLLLTTTSILFMYFCITFGSMITQRAKIVVAIAIFYGATTLVSTVSQIFFVMGSYSVGEWLTSLESGFQFASALNILLVMIIFFIAAIASLLYNFVIKILEQRLNLR